MVMGYNRYVDWLASTAMDLLLLDSLQSYKDIGKFWSSFRRNCQDMTEIIGLKVFDK